jgi:hypothetical protein
MEQNGPSADREGSNLRWSAERAPEPPVEPRAPELEAIETQLAERHWLSWIDTKVPALGNRTPRKAAKTPRGRERLDALLTEFARSAGRRPASAPNLALRRRLGLA